MAVEPHEVSSRDGSVKVAEHPTELAFTEASSSRLADRVKVLAVSRFPGMPSDVRQRMRQRSATPSSESGPDPLDREKTEKRMGWDSNPRAAFAAAGFQDRVRASPAAEA